LTLRKVVVRYEERQIKSMEMTDTSPLSQKRASFAGRALQRFLRLDIAKKMLLGYLAFALLIFLIGVFTLSGLEQLNRVNESIIRTDIAMIEISDRLIDAVLSQELYARRYAILKSPEMLALFWEREKEFDRLNEQALALPDVNGDTPVKRLRSLHARYRETILNNLAALGSLSSRSARKSEEEIRVKQEELIGVIKGLSSMARKQQNEKSLLIARISRRVFRITVVLSLAGFMFGIAATILFTRSIAGPITRLMHATRDIAEGRFDTVPEIRNQDELGDLAGAFREMAQRLKQLEETCLDANPLTRLPGSVAIETMLNRRLESGKPFAFCYVDMDNFKAFNDRYGYARGSEVIKMTAEVVAGAVAEHGGQGDFVGHIGGDDFVVITTPERYGETSRTIIERFDARIRDFYDVEDREKGYIQGKTRRGEEATFPIMSISIVVVTNRDRRFSSPLHVGEVAAELKDYAKELPGSVCVVDRRGKELSGA
jgi:diguanylate cyclase (GGDEF)-like protein